jgi:hypothetical protein
LTPLDAISRISRPPIPRPLDALADAPLVEAAGLALEGRLPGALIRATLIPVISSRR